MERMELETEHRDKKGNAGEMQTEARTIRETQTAIRKSEKCHIGNEEQ